MLSHDMPKSAGNANLPVEKSQEPSLDGLGKQAAWVLPCTDDCVIQICVSGLDDGANGVYKLPSSNGCGRL